MAVNLPTAMAMRGDGYVHCDRAAEGVQLLEEALKIAKAKKIAYDLMHIALSLGEGQLIAGRVEDALLCARDALKLARDRAQPVYEAGVALLLMGDISACHEPVEVDLCETHYRAAAKLFEDLGLRPWIARCHLGLGKLYRGTGKREQAREQLTTATTMFREMVMRFWLEKAEGEIAALK